jgi:hypothetical protein
MDNLLTVAFQALCKAPHNEESCIRRAATRNGLPQADSGPPDTIPLN